VALSSDRGVREHSSSVVGRFPGSAERRFDPEVEACTSGKWPLGILRELPLDFAVEVKRCLANNVRKYPTGLFGDDGDVVGISVVVLEAVTDDKLGFAAPSGPGWAKLRPSSWSVSFSLVLESGAQRSWSFLTCFVHVSSRSPKSPWTKIILLQISSGRYELGGVTSYSTRMGKPGGRCTSLKPVSFIPLTISIDLRGGG
jgi:hypothetical protein